MSQFIDQCKNEFNKVVDFFKRDVAGIRVGRASPSLVENINVNAYDSYMPLVQLASISMPDPKSLLIQPWDKNLSKEIEKAINASDLGVHAVIDGAIIRINFPPLTEETRKEVVKKLHQKMEESKVQIRNHREKIKEMVLKKEKDKEISEDDKFKMIQELDELVKEYNQKIKDVCDIKETEVMSI
jgi:ribosome recycling factor